MVVYSYALTELQKALYDQRSVCQDKILAACNVLALYEVGESLTTVLRISDHE